MSMLRKFIGETEDGDIRLKLMEILSSPLELGERAKIYKAILGLLMEISSDRDGRMGFEGTSKLNLILTFLASMSLHFLTLMV